MSGIKDTATVTLNINGAQAKKMMSELEQKISDTKQKISDLKANLADPKEIQKARKELKSYQKQLDEVKSATEGVNSALSNIDSATPRKLEKALKTLNKQLKDMTPGTETWNSHIEKIRELKQRISELKDETNEQQSLWQRFMDWSQNAWPALDLIGQWSGGFLDIARSAVDAFASVDQEMANVRKFTGMTEEQVRDLNVEFKKMDTRTSREDLNKLAQEAGRLGKTSKEDVLGFVRAADKINVALDDLGSGATLTLSKLTGIFGDEKIYGTEQSLLKVGSVINELSQNCSASAPYLAEFASRMGGVGAQAGMTIQQIMGFGAVLDSNEQKVEASATALSQVIVRMMQDPAKYAKVAGLEVEKFSEMLKKDANGALIMFLDTLQKAGGMDVLSPMFKDMGENGSRAISALSTLATNIEEVKAQQEAANIAFIEGTSIGNEFDVQNTTVQAGLEKCMKAAQEIRIELGEKLQPLLSHMLSSTSAIMRALLTTVKFLIEYKGAVISLGAAIAVYTLQVKGAAIGTAAWNVACMGIQGTAKILKSSVLLLRVVFFNLTGQVTKATASLRLFRSVTNASPLGLLLSALTVAIGFFVTLRLRADESKKALENTRREEEKWKKTLTDISETSAKAAAKEEAQLKSLYDTATNQAKSTDQRRAAVEQLQNLYPAYFKNLSAEQFLVGGAKEQYDKLRDSIIQAARARAAAAKIEDNESKLLELESKLQGEKNTQKARQSLYDKAIQNKQEAERQHRSAVDDAAIGDSREMNSKSTQDHVTALNKATDAVRDASNNLKEANTAVAQTERKIATINKANQELADKYHVSVTSKNSESDPELSTPSGYSSKIQADKDAKKADAAARAAAVKAKKEFKEQLDQIKAARDKEQAEIMALRMLGEINYLEYNERKLNADQKYYDDSIALYQKWGIQEDDECQALARKREEFLIKSNEQRLALNKETIQRIAQAEERDLKARYTSKSSHTLAEELRLEEEVLKIRYNALKDQQSLYKQTDKEYEDYQRQIDDLFLKDQESKQKKILEKINEFRRKFDYQAIHVKYDMERAALDELYRLKKIKEEEYRKWLEKLNHQQAEDEKKDKRSLPGMQKTQNSFTNAADAIDKYEKLKKELDEALADARINEQEYEIALMRLSSELRKALISPLQECKSEWVSMLASMTESWYEFADALKDPDGNPFVALGNAIESTAALATSVMSMITAFQKAELDIQTAAINKRYDREAKLAEGNSYKIKKAEKDKEKELAKLKSDAAKKQFAMQVIQAVAQTATNALNAYGSAAQVPMIGYILAPIAAAMAVAAGAVQIALIKKQQQASEAQGYAEGGFTPAGGKYEEAGVVHKGEWVASQKLVNNPRIRPLLEALDYAQQNNTVGAISADDVSRSIAAPAVLAAEPKSSDTFITNNYSSNNSDNDELNNTIAALIQRLDEPFVTVNTVTGDFGINKAIDDYNKLIRNKSPKSKK